MRQPDQQPDFEALIEAYLDGEIAQTDFVLLEEWLDQAPENCDLLVRRTREHLMFRDTLAAQQSTAPEREIVGVFGKVHRFVSQPIPFSWVLSAILTPFIVGAIIFLIAWWVSDSNLPGNDYCAEVASAQDAQWSFEETACEPGDVLSEGSWVKLKSGKVTLKFVSGAIVRLDGPCEFQIETGMAGFLRKGALTADVPSSAIGFTVDTPGPTVVDLGTKFFINVSWTGNRADIAVQVLKGSVELVTKGPQATRQKLVAGERSLIAGGALLGNRENSNREPKRSPNSGLQKVLIDETFSGGRSPRNTPTVKWATTDSSGFETYDKNGISARQMSRVYGGSNRVSANTPVSGAMEILAEDTDVTVSAKVSLPANLLKDDEAVLSFWTGQRISGNQGGFEHELEIVNTTDNRTILTRRAISKFENGTWRFNSVTLNLSEADSGDLLEIRFHERANSNDRGMQLTKVLFVLNQQKPNEE